MGLSDEEYIAESREATPEPTTEIIEECKQIWFFRRSNISQVNLIVMTQATPIFHQITRGSAF